MKQRIKSSLLIAALVATGVAAGAESALAYQGHMYAALGDLRSARFQLNAAIPDKAGHRVAAIGLVDQALAETNAAIAAGMR